MKRYVKLVILLIGIVFVSIIIFSLFFSKKTITYKVDDIKIYQQYIKVENNYYFKLNVKDKTLDFKISNNFKNSKKLITNIYLFNNNTYTCVLPMFNKNIYTDILCIKDDVIYLYRNLIGKNLELDKFASDMKEYGYIKDVASTKVKKSNGISIYNKNFKNDNTIIIPSYTGVYLIDSSGVNSIKLFNKDIYNQSINVLVSNYYLVANYNKDYSFNEFYLLNLKNNKVTTLISDTAISTNSYIQGVVDDVIYLIDRSNKKQYALDVFDNSVYVVGNSKKGIKYYENGKFINKSMYLALDNELLFVYNSIKSDKYDYVYYNNGLYYSYLKNKNSYDVYLSYGELSNIYTFAFTINNLDNILYSDSSVYYILEDTLYSYDLYNGSIPILKYSEFSYNDNLKFYVYEK